MALEQAFLDDIVAHPDDDTPRLIYADWLDENGNDEKQARAKLIRAQCELERPPVSLTRQKELQRQVRQVLKEYGRTWTEEVRKAKTGRNWTFRRGFVGEVTIPARKFARTAKDIFQLAPLLQSVHFPEASNEVVALATSPFLARLREVELDEMCMCGHCPIHHELQELFVSPHAANLRSLSLAGDRMKRNMIEALAKSPTLKKLQKLNLSDNPLDASTIEILDKSPSLTQLTELDLSSIKMTLKGMQNLIASRLLEQLTVLRLRFVDLGPRTLKLFTAAPRAHRLQRLDLSANQIGDAGAKLLMETATLPDIEELNLRDNDISPDIKLALRKHFKKRVLV